MNVSRKDIDQNNAVVTISVVKEDYADKVDKALRDYRKKANMPGFRPGKVPLGLIKKMYGNAVKAEEINNVISESLVKYIEDNDLAILGQPLPSEKEQPEIDFDTQDEFEFSFDIGLAPEFEVTLDGKDKVTYYEIEVTDEMIDNQIKSYTSRFGKYEQVDVVEEKDMVKGLVVELENGAAKEGGISAEDAVLTPAYIKDEEQKALFVGKKKGDKVVFNPAKAYENETEISSFLKVDKEAVKDLTSDFEVEIQGITRYIESEVNQELYDKVFGEGNVTSNEEFRAKIVEGIKVNLTSDSEYKFNIDARDMFVAKFKDLTFPEAFLKRWLLVNNKEMTAEKVDEDYPKMIEDLIWHLVKDKIAKDNEVKIEYPDVVEYAKKVARAQFAQYGMVGLGEDIIENYANDLLKQEETMRNFIDRAAEEKVLAIIRKKVKLDKKSISIEDFNKLFEPVEA
ncbi:MAG TPA: trigger factor [Bacteroidales bacterium]|nr:trigger factor [Bacteroidales bacterium]